MTVSSQKSVSAFFVRYAAAYERMIHLPGIAQIRDAEQQGVRKLLKEPIRPTDHVLEIGCGTGYYTRNLLSLAQRVTALDVSEAMLTELRRGLSLEDNARLTVVHSEATAFVPDSVPDAVVHIGVLDYIETWEDFLDHSRRYAGRVVLFTVPAKGILGSLYHLFSRMIGIRIQLFDRDMLESFVQNQQGDWRLAMELVGGMTWLVLLTRCSPANRQAERLTPAPEIGVSGS